MAIWQHDTTGERFDDKLSAKPGEEGFTREEAAKRFGNANFSYVGSPDWAPPADTE